MQFTEDHRAIDPRILVDRKCWEGWTRKGTYGDDCEVVAQLEIAPALETVGVGDKVGEGGIVEASVDRGCAVVVENVGELGGAVLGEGGGEEVADAVEEVHGETRREARDLGRGSVRWNELLFRYQLVFSLFCACFFLFRSPLPFHKRSRPPTLPTLYTPYPFIFLFYFLFFSPSWTTLRRHLPPNTLHTHSTST